MAKRKSEDWCTPAPKKPRWDAEEKEIMLEACQRADGVNAERIVAAYTRKMEAEGKTPRGFGACLAWIQSWRSKSRQTSRLNIRWTSDLRQLVGNLKQEGNNSRQISEIVSDKLGRPVSISQVAYGLTLRGTGPRQLKSETDQGEETLISTEVAQVAEVAETADTDTEDEFEATSTMETTDESTSSETTSQEPVPNSATEIQTSVESPTDTVQNLADAFKVLADFTITRLNNPPTAALTRSDVAIRSFVDGFKDTVCVADRVRFIRLLATDQVTATMFCGMDEDSRRFVVDGFLAGYQLQL